MSVRDIGRTNEILTAFSGFVPLVAAALILFLPGLAFLGETQSANFCQVTEMCVSTETPWGVVTSIFMYDGPLNVTTFLLLAGIFVSMNIGESHNERKRRSLCLLIFSFAAAMIANFFWMFVTPNTISGNYVVIHASYGQSGVVYGVLGSLVAGFLSPAFPKGRTVAEIRTYFSSRVNVLTCAGSILLSCCLLYLILWSPELIFGAAQEFNVLVHEMAFFIAFSLSLPFYLLGKVAASRGLGRRNCPLPLSNGECGNPRYSPSHMFLDGFA